MKFKAYYQADSPFQLRYQRGGMFRSFKAPLLAAAFLSLSLLPARASAQGEPLPLDHVQFGVGYVADAPTSMGGGAFYFVMPRWGGVGLYFDAKFDVSKLSGEQGYDPSITARQVLESVPGQSYLKTEEDWWSVNMAVVKALSPFFSLYAGGGIARATPYLLFTVPQDATVGLGGVLWAEDPEGVHTEVNLMFGMMTRLTSHVTAQFGYEAQPKGVTAGLTLRIPRW